LWSLIQCTRTNRFAFVTFEEKADAEDAKAKYESYQVEGRTLRIDWDVGADKKPQRRVDESRGADGRDQSEPIHGNN
jgi:RNA recognition motif-containing protein